MRTVFLFLYSLFLFSCGSDLRNSAPLMTEAPGIIGGTRVTVESNMSRSIVGIYDTNNHFICTGSLMPNNIVLTAAHCIESPAHQIRIIFGLELLSTFHAREVDIQENYIRKAKATRVHPEWNEEANLEKKGQWNDIALIQFHGTVPEGFIPATILTDRAELKTGATAIMAGFGSTEVLIEELDIKSIPNLEEKEANGEVACDDTREHCYKIEFNENDVLNETEAPIENIEQGEVRLDETNGHGTCVGDSGGPAYILKDDVYYLFGVTSRGSMLCDGTGVYTNLLDYKEWLEKNLQELGRP